MRICLKKSNRYISNLALDLFVASTLIISIERNQTMGGKKLYTIKEMAEMAGVSARTLRYYDTIGLLKPAFTNEAGYRFYGE